MSSPLLLREAKSYPVEDSLFRARSPLGALNATVLKADGATSESGILYFRYSMARLPFETFLQVLADGLQTIEFQTLFPRCRRSVRLRLPGLLREQRPVRLARPARRGRPYVGSARHRGPPLRAEISDTRRG